MYTNDHNMQTCEISGANWVSCYASMISAIHINFEFRNSEFGGGFESATNWHELRNDSDGQQACHSTHIYVYRLLIALSTNRSAHQSRYPSLHPSDQCYQTSKLTSYNTSVNTGRWCKWAATTILANHTCEVSMISWHYSHFMLCNTLSNQFCTRCSTDSYLGSANGACQCVLAYIICKVANPCQLWQSA